MTWVGGLRRRTRREIVAGLLVVLGLTAFVLVTYVVVVLGGGALTGHTSTPDVALSVLATAIVALAFDPVQTRLELRASRVVHGQNVSPYDALRQFSQTVTGAYAAEELPARMAHVLTDGTGAAWSQVWLVVADQPSLAATWPATAEGAPTDGELERALTQSSGRRSLPVLHGGDLLGFLVVQERPDLPMTSVEERLFAGLADHAGLVLRGAVLRAELNGRVEELSTRAEELRRSRQRLVDVQDEKRRLLERDIHDGAQQHLVALAVNLSLARTIAGRAPERAEAILAEQASAAAAATVALTELASGIYPQLLADEGLATALKAAVTNSPIPVEVTVQDVARYTRLVEAAAYFCSLEALQNAAKHSGASRIWLTLSGQPDGLGLTVEDDGSGFDPTTTPPGSGLANMAVRVESAGGTLARATGHRGGALVRAWLPTTSSTELVAQGRS